MAFWLTLAQQKSTTYADIITWALVLLAVVGVGIIVIAIVRRRAHADDAPIGLPFTLSDLRQMRDAGQLSEQEFERAKSRVIEISRRSMDAREKQRAPQTSTTDPAVESDGGESDPPRQADGD